jgi:hypothetical protein
MKRLHRFTRTASLLLAAAVLINISVAWLFALLPLHSMTTRFSVETAAMAGTPMTGKVLVPGISFAVTRAPTRFWQFHRHSRPGASAVHAWVRIESYRGLAFQMSRTHAKSFFPAPLRPIEQPGEAGLQAVWHNTGLPFRAMYWYLPWHASDAPARVKGGIPIRESQGSASWRGSVALPYRVHWLPFALNILFYIAVAAAVRGYNQKLWMAC